MATPFTVAAVRLPLCTVFACSHFSSTSQRIKPYIDAGDFVPVASALAFLHGPAFVVG